MTTSALHHRGEQVEAHGLVLLASLIEGKPAQPRLAVLLLYYETSPRPYPPPRAWPFFGALGFLGLALATWRHA